MRSCERGLSETETQELDIISRHRACGSVFLMVVIRRLISRLLCPPRKMARRERDETTTPASHEIGALVKEAGEPAGSKSRRFHASDLETGLGNRLVLTGRG